MTGEGIVDLSSFAGILAITIVLTQFIKQYVPWVAASGKNTRLVVAVLAVGLTVCSKAFGYGFAELDWLPAILTGFGNASVAMLGSDTTKRVTAR